MHTPDTIRTRRILFCFRSNRCGAATTSIRCNTTRQETTRNDPIRSNTPNATPCAPESALQHQRSQQRSVREYAPWSGPPGVSPLVPTLRKGPGILPIQASTPGPSSSQMDTCLVFWNMAATESGTAEAPAERPAAEEAAASPDDETGVAADEDDGTPTAAVDAITDCSAALRNNKWVGCLSRLSVVVFCVSYGFPCCSRLIRCVG